MFGLSHSLNYVAMVAPEKTHKPLFTRYEKFMIAIMTILQFTVILDFMVLSPLGAILMPALKITPKEFGWVVSAYAFSAGISGVTAAGFADRFDRKKMLLVFYLGFIAGTLFCGLAPDFYTLLAARIVTGAFGGVIGSIAFAIGTDLFPMEVRGRVMGFLQTAFAASQIFGIPLGLYAANHWGWHYPFLLIVALGIPVGLVIFFAMQPVDAHLKLKTDRKAFHHLVSTVSKPRYIRGFAATTLLATGGWMLMPFASAFSTGNLGLKLEELPSLYMVSGITAMIAGPLVGKLADQFGKYRVFLVGSTIGMGIVFFYTRIGVTPMWQVMILNSVLFAVITARIVSASALMSAVPTPQDRGAFMSVSSAFQQISGGIASAVAGAIVLQMPDGRLENYDTLGLVVVCAMAITIVMMYFIHKVVHEKLPGK